MAIEAFNECFMKAKITIHGPHNRNVDINSINTSLPTGLRDLEHNCPQHPVIMHIVKALTQH